MLIKNLMVSDNLMPTELLAFSKLHYASRTFMRCVAAFIQLKNKLITCERQYLKNMKM